MSYDDYLKMIRELSEIREDIIINNEGCVGVGRRFVFKKQNIKEKIDVLERAIKMINKRPRTSLTPKYVKKSYNQINKMTYKTVLEKSIYPYKNSFTAVDYDENNNIYENKVIKKVLLSLKEKIKEYEEFYDQYIKNEKSEIDGNKKRFNDSAFMSPEEKVEILTARKNKVQQQTDIVTANKIISKISDNKMTLEVFKNSQLDDGCISISYDDDKDTFVLNLNYLGSDIRGCKFYKNYIVTKNINAYYLNISLSTNDIDNMIFFVNELKNVRAKEDTNCTSIASIVMDVETHSTMPGRRYSTLKINSNYIYSVGNEQFTCSYSEEERREFIEKYYVDNDEETLGLLNSILEKEENTKDIEAKVEDNDSWDALQLRIDELLKLPMFKDVTPKNISAVKPTQIFVNDKFYRRVYKTVKDLNKSALIIDMKSPEAIMVKSTCDIYEIWCLFKIIQILVVDERWTLLNSKEVADRLAGFMAVKQSLSDEELEFKLIKQLKDGVRLSLSVIYEGRIYYDENRFKTPDYQFIYTVYKDDKEVKKIRAYLDAKYRNYQKQGPRQYDKDLQDVAIDKYIKSYIGTDNEPVCSMILHSYKDEDNDKKYVDWGSDNDKTANLSKQSGCTLKPHSYGIFYTVPSDTRNLKKFLRILTEYHLYSDTEKVYKTCWQCGEVNDVTVTEKLTKGKNSKYHCKCNKCGEFWVKNHCLEDTTHYLIKHVDNYHKEKKSSNNPWRLICPVCGNDGSKSDDRETKQYSNNSAFYDPSEMPF